MGTRFHEHGGYSEFLYQRFPNDPNSELCKLSGLPKPSGSEHDG